MSLPVVFILLAVLSCRWAPSFLQPQPTATPVPPRSEPVAQAFLQAWEQGEYEAMYELLSSPAKASVSQEAFVQRYQDVAAEATIISVDAEIRSVLQKGDGAQVAYGLTLETSWLAPSRPKTLCPSAWRANAGEWIGHRSSSCGS